MSIVETKILKIDETIKLESGSELRNVEVAYETYGTLNSTKDNAILLLHARKRVVVWISLYYSKVLIYKQVDGGRYVQDH